MFENQTKSGIILPHYKNYKLKKILPAIENSGDTVTKYSENLDNINLDEIDFFICSGMKNIKTDNVSIKSFNFIELSEKPTLIIESAALRMLPHVNSQWLKIVWNSFFMDQGIHPYDEKFDRWQFLSKRYGIIVHDYQRRGSSILFNLQKEFDAALNRLTFNGIDYCDWCLNQILNIRKFSDRPIIIRRHPLEDTVERFLKQNLKDKRISFSQNSNFYDDLNESWCMISYNSTSTVESTIYGTHTICLDSSAFAWEVSGKTLEDIELDLEFDRTNWLKKIAYMQWHLDELQDPYVWNLVKSCIWK
jgi:hypothetical protein